MFKLYLHRVHGLVRWRKESFDRVKYLLFLKYESKWNLSSDFPKYGWVVCKWIHAYVLPSTIDCL